MMNDRKAYEEQFAAQLSEWRAKLALFNAKAEQAKAETKIEYYKTIDTLQAKHDAARTKLQELRVASDGAWEELKIGAENVWTEVKSAFSSAASKFN